MFAGYIPLSAACGRLRCRRRLGRSAMPAEAMDVDKKEDKDKKPDEKDKKPEPAPPPVPLTLKQGGQSRHHARRACRPTLARRGAPLSARANTAPFAPFRATELSGALVLVEKYVSSKEVRFMANATRLLPVLRRKVQASPTKSVRTLVETVSQALAPSNATRKLLLTQLETLAATLPADMADVEAGKEEVRGLTLTLTLTPR